MISVPAAIFVFSVYNGGFNFAYTAMQTPVCI